MGTTEKIRTEFLPDVSNGFAFSPEVEYIYSPLFVEYFSNSTGKKEVVVNTATGPVEDDVAGYEANLIMEPEGAPPGDNEIKAE